MDHPPLSDAERQRRRRQRLKAKADEAKFAPEGYIAEAVRDLGLAKVIPEALITRVCEEAAKIAQKQNPELNIVLQKYAEKKINDFFTPEEN